MHDGRPHTADRPTVGALMTLIAGAAFGLALVLRVAPLVRDSGEGHSLWWVFVMGGLSLMGPPLILMSRAGPWREGRLLWFTLGIAAWLLWPPIVYDHIYFKNASGGTSSYFCFVYGRLPESEIHFVRGSPLLAVFTALGLIFAGTFRKSRRRRIRQSWQECFGILLSIVWAVIGCYLIGTFYIVDILRQ
jgi:hypothetical protein